MAGTLQFDLVSPERRLASFAATDVQIPGSEGDMTAMEGHAPTITTLRPGILRAHSAGGMQAFVVTGGFAEINAGSITVLAEKALPIEEATGTVIDGFVTEARELLAVALPEDRDMAEKMLADTLALKASAGY